MKKFLTLNDYIKFFPLLIVYTVLCTIKSKDILIGDEGRYLGYADNLLNGFYAYPLYDTVFLWNGPGYPILLAVFKSLDFSLFSIRLFNCLFIYFSIVLFFKSLTIFIQEKPAVLITLLLGLYYPFLDSSIPYVLTEALSFLLISLVAYNLIKYLNKNSRKNLWLTVLALGYLALTKIIFAYVILSLIIIFVPFVFFKKTVTYTKKYVLVLSLSFCFTIPYLAYTYSITNKYLYYGNSGGMSLYWMSTPYEHEFGDWNSFATLKEEPLLYKNHHAFINSIEHLYPVEKDIALKEKAIENIKNNKFKFFKNWNFNISRLFFGHPFSTYVKPRDSLILISVYNVILLVSLVVTIILSILHFRNINPIFHFFGSFIITYLGGVSLLSAYPRFLHIVLPMILIWICYTLNKFVSIKLQIRR